MQAGSAVGKYRTGFFKVKNGKNVLFLSNQDKAVVFETTWRWIVAAPDNNKAFVQSLKAYGYLE